MSLSQIESAVRAIDTEIERLRSRMLLLESSWSGEAQQSFFSRMRKCEAQLNRLQHLAADARRVAQTSVTRLNEFDNQRAVAWKL
ncbi:WXG100 family type VII secretion target [Lysinibacter cavernae]|uniref:WXG100 family type VII secretion target n=2 Tax=Lysinibacter cavernae TaxID=1640652 RepID=A0A7X5R078_9MICO|nr:WXG100 family type VII secretion target [Lysinibacter cavernae]